MALRRPCVENELAAGNEASIVSRCKGTKQINFPGAQGGLMPYTTHARIRTGNLAEDYQLNFHAPLSF